MIDNKYLAGTDAPYTETITQAAAGIVFGFFIMWLGVTIIVTVYLGWVGFGGSLGIAGALITWSIIKDAEKKAKKFVAIKGGVS